MKKNIVILYSKNHMDQTAIALKEEFSKRNENYNLIAIKTDEFTNFCGAKISEGFYKFSIRNMPWLNQLIGLLADKLNSKREDASKKKKKETKEQTSDDNNTQPVVNVSNKPVVTKEEKEGFIEKYRKQLRKVDNIITRYDPEIIVCTTPRSLTKALWAKERTNCRSIICAALTDYCVDRGFNSAAADYFIVQNSAEKQTLETLGIEEKKIIVCGTPIVDAVKKEWDRQEVLKELGVENENLPIVTIVGGRYGSGRIKSAFKDLAVYSGNFNIIVMTNGAQSVKSFISSYCKSSGITSNVYCVDEISDMSKIYSITDCMVTAPTASITYEAMSRKIPVVLMKPSNNVESGNYSYLTSNAFALRGEKHSHIVPSVLSCINKEEEEKIILKNIEGKFPQNTAEAFANTILELIPQQVEQVEMEMIDVKSTIELDTSNKTKNKGKKKND